MGRCEADSKRLKPLPVVGGQPHVQLDPVGSVLGEQLALRLREQLPDRAVARQHLLDLRVLDGGLQAAGADEPTGHDVDLDS